MIQRATDPNTSRLGWRPSAKSEDKQAAGGRGRASHAWPFLSKLDQRPLASQQPKNFRNDSGS